MNKRLILITILLAGALTALAWFMLRPDPENVILQAQKKLVNEKLFRVETDFTVDGVFDRPELSFGESRIIMQGRTRTDADRADPTSVVTSSAFDLSLRLGDERLVMTGEGRRKDHLHYLRLDEVSDALFPGIEEVRGQWMRSVDPFLELLIQPIEDDLVLNDLTAEGFDEIHGALSAVPMVTFEDSLPSETIDGVKTFHYAVKIRQDAMAAIMTRIRELRTGVPARPEEYALELAKVMSWGEATGEVWIGEKDLRFRKISFASLLSEPTGGSRLEAQIFFTRYGEEIAVETPDAEDIEDLLGRVISGRLLLAGDRTVEEGDADVKEISPENGSEDEMAPTEDGTTPDEGGSSPGTAPGTEPDAEDTESGASPVTDADGDGLSDTDEFIYGSDPWNPDSDADGWSDGVEVANGKDPMGPGVLFGFGL